MAHAVERIEKAIGTSPYTPETLQKEITSMKIKLADLQERLEQIEKQAIRV